MLEDREKWIWYNQGIRMLEEASGCLEDVSGCSEGASRCVHLPAPETTNRDAETCKILILIITIRRKLGKDKSQLNITHHKDWIRIKNLKKHWYNQFQKIWSCFNVCINIYIFWKLNRLIRDNEIEDSILIKYHEKWIFQSKH